MESLLDAVEKCLYCGFCEALCPTIRVGPHRGYGPRGRIALIKYYLDKGSASRELVSSIFSCLLCGSCVRACPALIDVPDLVRRMRSILVADVGFEGIDGEIVAIR
ncbi:MAG: (Fe-S)-binding protein [Hyperthermus sp.]|nr:MAG: (Fe-S)-binding protein [Hyperthermus sp.]